MPAPKRSPVGFPAALLAVALGISMYYGYAWYALPTYSEEEIDQSAEINVALDLRQSGKPLPTDAAEMARLRNSVRAEVVAEIEAEKKRAIGPFVAGIMGLLFALGQIVIYLRSGK